MSQYDFGTINTSTTSGSDLATLLGSWRDALLTNHVGNSRPSYIKNGMIWIDNSSTPWVLKLYQGGVDITLGYVDITDGLASFLSYAKTFTKSAAYTVQTSDRDSVILVDASAGPVTITLLTGATAKNGFGITIIKNDATANAVTIQRSGTNTIAGQTSVAITARYEGYTLISNGGGQWHIQSYFTKNLPNSSMANMNDQTVKGNNSGASNTPQDLTMSQLRTMLDVDEAGKVSGLTSVTGTAYTLVLTDRGNLVDCNNAAAINLTVPTFASVAIPVRSRVDIIQSGTGQVTIVPASGVTIYSAAGKMKLTQRYSAATLVKIANNTWYLIGDLTS